MNNLSYEQAEKQIQKEYIDKCVAFLKGEATKVCTPAEYLQVYNVVVKQCDECDNGELLYKYVQRIIRKFIDDFTLPKVKNEQGNNLLKAFALQWQNFLYYSRMVDKMFDYLNRYYLKNASLPQLGMTCLQMFSKYCYDAIKVELRAEVLRQLSEDRNQNNVDRDVLAKCIQAYVIMGYQLAKPQSRDGRLYWHGEKMLNFYEEQFEEPYLAAVRNEYAKLSQQWATQENARQYLLNVDRALNHEESLADLMLQPETKPKLTKDVEKELITKKYEIVLNKDTGIKHMLKEVKKDDMKLLYKCFKRDDQTLPAIIKLMEPYIVERGDAIVKDEENIKDPIAFTTKLLALKKEMDELVDYSFSNDMKFQKGRDSAFQKFMNACQATPQYMAHYSDMEMREGLKQMSNEQVDQRLQAIVRLFCCLHGRDIFIKAYSENLAKRLLNKTSVSQEAEELMLQKFKVECGLNIVNNMTTMFKDMENSKIMQNEFKQKYPTNTLGGVEFQSEVLTTGNWPVEASIACEIPSGLSMLKIRFEEFYRNKHSNRQLKWLYQHGYVELHSRCFKKGYQFVVNVFQTTILDMYNKTGDDEFTYGQIKEKTQIPEKQLNAALLSMANPKVKLLIKQNKNPKFESDAEKFTLNTNFANQAIRMTLIPVQSMKEKIKTGEPQVAEVAKERKFVIDAKIVQIMKTKKEYKHANLISDVIQMITMFRTQPPDVKQRIEDLIQRQYLERKADDRSTYVYLP